MCFARTQNQAMPPAAQASAPAAEQPSYGKRLDGTEKGEGFLGKLKNSNGDISTELSVSYEINGKEILMPSLVPTLTDKEVKHLLDNKPPTKEMDDKIIDHAMKRIKEGKSPFAQPDEWPSAKEKAKDGK
jgi:hypothetical protein